MKILKKMGLTSLNAWKKGVLKEMVEKAADPVFVGRILGQVRAVEVVPSPYGEALKFKGDFVGYGADGEESRSVVCYLPSPLDEMLSAQVREIQSVEGNERKAVDFAFDGFAQQDKCEAGYKFILRPLVETKPADPVAALLANLPTLKLDAPKTDAQQPLLDQQPEAGGAQAPEKTGKK